MTNPKEAKALSDGKAMTQYIPAGLIKDLAKVFYYGAVVRKRGRFNWRTSRIKASTYWAAIERHMDDWKCGEDLDPDTGVSHLQHIKANCDILLDAANHHSLIDDRDEPGTPPTQLEHPPSCICHKCSLERRNERASLPIDDLVD